MIDLSSLERQEVSQMSVRICAKVCIVLATLLKGNIR